MLTELIVKEK